MLSRDPWKIKRYVRDELATFEQVYTELQQESFFQELMGLREKARDKWER